MSILESTRIEDEMVLMDEIKNKHPSLASSSMHQLVQGNSLFNTLEFGDNKINEKPLRGTVD